MIETQASVKFVPAVCPKCGGQLEVDPTQEAAVCKYCGTPFVVEKAIQNYNIQHAHIDHVDSVHVDMKGSVDSVIGFVEREIDKNREVKRESKRLDAENSQAMMKIFFKYFAIISVAMIVIWVAANALGLLK